MRPLTDVASEFAQAAKVLHAATQSWPNSPPVTGAQLDAIERQVQGLRRSLVDMRIATNPEKS